MHDMIKNIFKEYTLEIFVLQYINYFKSKLNQRILSIKYVSILVGYCTPSYMNWDMNNYMVSPHCAGWNITNQLITVVSCIDFPFIDCLRLRYIQLFFFRILDQYK